jgi:signal peptidase I
MAEPYYIEPQKPPFYKRFTKSIGKGTFRIAEVIVVIFTILIILYLFIISPHIVDGQSMQPNLCDKDIYVALKQGSYDIGNVIVFKYNDEKDFVKRVVGVGGDTMLIENGRVYRNSVELKEAYLPPDTPTTIDPGNPVIEGQDYVVPNGMYFVMGDNREHSTDSRVFGAIDPETHPIKGKVLVVGWPIGRLRLFDQTKGFAKNTCD